MLLLSFGLKLISCHSVVTRTKNLVFPVNAKVGW